MSEIDRCLVGTETTPFTVELERGAIHRFAEAIGKSNPDQEQARKHFRGIGERHG